MTTEKLNELRVYADAYLDIRDCLNERERRELLARGCLRFGHGSAYNLKRVSPWPARLSRYRTITG